MSLPDGIDNAKPMFLEQVRAILRIRHCGLRTEKASVGWIRRFILFHSKRHPSERGAIGSPE
jgi:integrase-like protein